MIMLKQQEIDSVLKLSGKQRYTYFIKKVTDTEVIWALYKDGWALVRNDADKVFMPIWPYKEYAQLLCMGEWLEYQPAEIDLYEFIEEVSQELKKNNIAPCIFLTPNDFGVCLEMDILLSDIENKLDEDFFR
ncbi:MAG: DUF2750 domain-containing protein [Rickettsiaceae bacterium]|nr:DUF2750 domain-containing protein [Rickettsiaceae bacterium]